MATGRKKNQVQGLLSTPIFLYGVLFFLLFFVGLNACVETAECDETVGCSDGQICYDLKCEVRCEMNTAEVDQECGATRQCLPCLENVGAGIRDHCFSEDKSACLLVEASN